MLEEPVVAILTNPAPKRGPKVKPRAKATPIKAIPEARRSRGKTSAMIAIAMLMLALQMPPNVRDARNKMNELPETDHKA